MRFFFLFSIYLNICTFCVVLLLCSSPITTEVMCKSRTFRLGKHRYVCGISKFLKSCRERNVFHLLKLFASISPFIFKVCKIIRPIMVPFSAIISLCSQQHHKSQDLHTLCLRRLMYHIGQGVRKAVSCILAWKPDLNSGMERVKMHILRIVEAHKENYS